MSEDFITKYKIHHVCSKLLDISRNPAPLLKVMKFLKQSPVVHDSEIEYDSIFKDANYTFMKQNYHYKKDVVKQNAFVQACILEKTLRISYWWRQRNCNLFRRSFTTNGIGYTFNNIQSQHLYKNQNKENIFYINDDKGRVQIKKEKNV